VKENWKGKVRGVKIEANQQALDCKKGDVGKRRGRQR